jgi:DNA-binding MarR family transcriptional regulator
MSTKVQARITDTQNRLLHEIAAGRCTTPKLVRAIGLSRPTVDKRLQELMALGEIEIEEGSGRTASLVSLSAAGKRRLAASESAVNTPTTTPEPIMPSFPSIAVWLRPALEDQQKVAEQLHRAGAAAVFDCHGDATVIALYPGELASDVYEELRRLAVESHGPAGYAVIMGPASNADAHPPVEHAQRGSQITRP